MKMTEKLNGILSVLIISTVCCLTGIVRSQGTPSEGKDCYIGFLHSSFNTVIPSLPRTARKPISVQYFSTGGLGPSQIEKPCFPFMVYYQGNRAIDSMGNVGQVGINDNFFSYSMPIGITLGTGDTADMTITVDTLCSSWRLCVTDNRVVGGIKSIIMLDDPSGDFDPPPPGHRMYAYENASFEPQDDSTGKREVIFDTALPSRCINIRVDNILKDAYAPIKIVDNAGNYKIIDLLYKKQALQYNPSTNDVVYLGLLSYGQTSDSILTIINLPSSERSYTIEEVKLTEIDTSFHIQILQPTAPLPFVLKPGDSLLIKVTAHAFDTASHRDSLMLKADCFMKYWGVEFDGGTGLIAASDHDFGNVIRGQTRCVDTLTIKNVGTDSMMVWDEVESNNPSFTFSNISMPVGKHLPITLAPGQYIKVRVCYSSDGNGLDSAIINWKTNISGPYKTQVKSYSKLKANGIDADLRWDRKEGLFRADSTKEVILRVYLVNPASAPMHIDKVYLDGPDVSQFRIVQQQLPVLENFVLDTGLTEAKWFDIGFTTNISDPLPRRYAFLHAKRGDSLVTLPLLAGFDVMHVKAISPFTSAAIHPNPTIGNIALTVELTEQTPLTITIRDVLGNERISLPKITLPAGKSELSFTTDLLPSGTYFLSLNGSNNFEIIKFIKE